MDIMDEWISWMHGYDGWVGSKNNRKVLFGIVASAFWKCIEKKSVDFIFIDSIILINEQVRAKRTRQNG